MYNRLIENKPSSTKHVEDIINISLEKVNFVGLYSITVTPNCVYRY